MAGRDYEDTSLGKSLPDLIDAAWKSRRMARVSGATSVGASVLSDAGRIYIGCNITHEFRSHDIHAEVGALASMVAAGGTRAVAVVVASTRERLTPCGACMDWIFELGGPTCEVYLIKDPATVAYAYTAELLMPFYPR